MIMDTEVISSVPKEQLKLPDTERESIEMLRSFLEMERFDPRQNYSGLCSYVESRGSISQVSRPIHLLLKYEYMEKQPNYSELRTIRYNPLNQEIYNKGDWPRMTRAFHSPERGTFLDFPTQSRGQEKQDFLEGYQATNSLIDFGYTCEHELRHDIQQQRLNAREVSYYVLSLAKDYIMLRLLHHFTGGEYFYDNAHDDLFLEMDANDHANEFMDKVIPPSSSLAGKIVNPNDLPEHRYTVAYLLSQRIKEGAGSHHDIYTISLGENTIGLYPQKYNGNAEEIVSDFCDDILKRYPSLIKTYPALELEYNEDGSRRSLSEIKSIIEGSKHGGYVFIGGQRIDSKRLGIIYHRLCKHSRKLQEEISGSTSSK
jgi:hypothetical protein